MSEDRTAQARQIANEAELAHGDRCFFKVRVNACECDLGKRRQRLESAILAALTSASAAKDEEIARLRKAIEAVLDDDVMTDRLYGSPLADMLRAALSESR